MKVVTKKERAEIRKDLRSVLKSFSRENLLSQWYEFPWAPALKDEKKMEQAKIAMAGVSDQLIIKMILDRDVEDVVKTLEKGR